MKDCRGFSLVELLVVMAIIAILSTVVGVYLWPEVENARVVAASEQIGMYKTALERYRAAHGMLPSQRQGLEALYREPTSAPIPKEYPGEGYMDSSEIKPDPWGNVYVYFSPGRSGQSFEIVSYGADGEEGGEGKDADISSSDL